MNDLVQVLRPDGNLPVHRWLPPTGSGPGLLVLQEIFGISAYIRERCAAFAAAGYVVYAPELYFRLGTLEFDESRPGFIQEGMSAAQQLDWNQTTADASATLDALRGAAECTGKVGIVGYCFGGGLGFQVAAQNSPDALVSYYGSGIPGLLALAPNVTCPSQHHWGLADSYFPADVVEQVQQAVTATNPKAEFHTYAGAEHAFDNPTPMLHHPVASKLARQRTLDFLAEQLATASS